MAHESPEDPSGPRNAIVVLLDSLNRHMLGCYGGTEFNTPNIDRLARRSVRFDAHFAGSLPCIPARHDILCGNLDFLWRPWGSVELWEEPLSAPLRRAGVKTMLVSDHPHLFEVGGENYHCDFSGWDYQRGHDPDPWRTRPDPGWIGTPNFGRGGQYDNNRSWFKDEEDFPCARTMKSAARWPEGEAPHHDRFLLYVDEFDPHEPFDAPEPYMSMYDDTWEGPHLMWPPYQVGALAQGVINEREARQIRACYGAKLTMVDAWLGRLLDTIDRRGLWDDTAVILCTDHGHYLGERDQWGKPQSPIYAPMGHTPLLIAWPGVPPGSCGALTTAVDIFATLADIFGAQISHRTHGHSIAPLITGLTSSIRDHALSGIWGREVQLITSSVKYSRAPAGPNEPLSMWSNRWSTMPISAVPDVRLPMPDDRAFLDRMPGSSIPVIRQPFRATDFLPYWAYGPFTGNHLYRWREDPGEERDLRGTGEEAEAAEQLRQALLEIEAPEDQLARLGLK